MTGEKIEKMFWAMLILWAVLRLVLMGAQLTGNTDPDYISRVKQYFTQEQIDEGKKYALSGFWLKAVYGFAYVGLLVILLKAGFFAWLYNQILARVGYGIFKSEILFVIAFLLLLRLISLPYSYYMGFIRETNMGFSNLTALAWFLRYCKSALVGIGLETAGILLLVAVVRRFSVNWVYIVPVAMGMFSLAVTLLYPILITPIFYNKQPLQDQQLKKRLLAIGRQSGMEIEEVFVVDESRYSKHTNAYFTGVGPYRRIVLYDNLINNLSDDEVALIFAHEAGHWWHNHVAKGLALGFLGMIAISLAVKFCFPAFSQVHWFGLRQLHCAANLPFFMILVITLQLFLAPIESQISQKMEVQADRAALEFTGLRDVYIAAEKKLAIDNKSDLLPSPLRVFWLYSHPPAVERIELADR